MGNRNRGSSAMWWFAVMVILLIIGSAAAIVFASEPGLLDHATRLASTGSWVAGYGGYYWESDRSVLSFRPAGIGVNAVSVDITTGAESPRLTLSNDFIGSKAEIPAQWRLSPDGKYLVWRIDNVGVPRWVVSDLAGRRVKTWKQSYGSYSPLWLAGNRRWMEHTNGNRGLVPIIHSLDGPDVRCAPITGPFSWPLGVTPDARVVTFEWHPEKYQIVWYEYPLAPKPAPATSRSVVMPKSADALIEAELSPTGDRIACLVHYTYLSPIERLMVQFLRQTIKPHQKLGLWILHRDGSHTRFLGAEESSSASSLLWTPDGKRLSLYDHDALYSVPVPGE